MRLWIAPSAFHPHRGGVEEMSLQLARALSAGGDDVVVVTHRHPPELAAREIVEGVEVRRLDFSAPRLDPLALLRFLSQLPAIQRALDALGSPPELINVQCVANQVPHLVLYAGRHRVPFVLSTHGEVVMDADAIFEHSAYMRRALLLAARRASALTACSSWAAEHTAPLAPRFAHARVIPAGVDPAQWSGSPLPEQPILCAWGRHVRQKGFNLAIEAFALLRERVGDARLLIGGGGAETPRLRELAGDGVEFVGPVDRDGVRALLARSRVVVVPSRIEPFGIVALEGLASGRGLVYAAGTGLAEAAGGLGRAADPRDAEALADAMAAELAEPTAAAAGGARAAELSWTLIGERYRALYAELLAQ